MSKPELFSVRHHYTQDGDTCGGEDIQTIDVFTECPADIETDTYIVIETSRWALNPDEIDGFAAMLKRVAAQVTDQYRKDTTND